MDADEALQMFFDEEDTNVPIARFSDSDLPESDDWDNPSSPDEETASSDEENLYGGSGQPSVDGQSSSESEKSVILLLSSTACVDYNS